MSYTVLARRYRSTDFDEVVGQEAIARTLKNAIEQNRTAHAYLFTGTRGVGKTSMARIFAKALNATDDLAQKDDVARAILRGEDIDVIEIDAASNRGIDEVRDLIANAGLTPARSPHKIYIIDEVHMLTGPAFNALLKTMEEPPSHVKFILCTTEPHQVPATIQSRCQRFDFRNIPAARIREHLEAVLEREGIEADEAVVAQVAQQAGGSMRDGLSLLDRLIAASDGRLTVETLEDTLGLPDQSLVAQLVDAVLDANPREALEASGRLLERGIAVDQALNVLVDYLRNLMVIATCGAESDLVELFGEARETAAKQAARVDLDTLVYTIALAEASSRNARSSPNARAIFDAVVVRLALADHFAPAAALAEGDVASAPGRNGSGSAVEKKKPAAVPDEREPKVTRAEPTSPAASRPAPPPPAEARPSPGSGPSEGRAAAERDPLVREAMSIFDASVVVVRDLDDRPRKKD